MGDPTDDMTQQAIEQGHRNAEAIVLIKKHCAHARVEHSRHFGWSMLEDLTGLPISGREMRCEYGRVPTSLSMDLLSNAIAFYEENCIGCPHRQVQAIPNLKGVADEAIGRRERHQQRVAQSQQEAEEARNGRARRRAQRAAADEPETRHLIALLDGIDAEPPDERADELVDLCRLRPELCTDRAAEILLETAAEIPSDRLFAALRHLDSARKLDRDRLLLAAIEALKSEPLSHAAELVVDLQDGLAAGQLIPALPAFTRLAAPPHDFGFAPTPQLAPLKLAATTELPALLDSLREGIGAEDKYRRRVAAGAAARLLEFEPSVAQVLVESLIDALSLPDSLSHYMGDPRGELMAALQAALVADPHFTTDLIERRAGGESPDVRSALFHVFDGVIRGAGRYGAAPRPGADHALDAAFRRLSGDWGDDVIGEASRLLELAAEWEPELMAARVDQLFGALLTLIATPAQRSSALETPDLPPVLRVMQQQSEQIKRNATIRELREALGELVPHAPEAVARNVFSVIVAPDIESDEAKELRHEMVRLLGDLGRRPDLLPDVLPALWTALVHADQSVRAGAVEAWQEIARVRHRELPPDLAELLPTLLLDPYVIVHRAVVRALRFGLPVAEAQRDQVLQGLLVLADHYRTEDSDLLEDILHTIWGLSRRFPDAVAEHVRELCLQWAEHLDRYDKERFVEWHAEDGGALPSYVPRLIEVVADPARHSSGRDDGPLRLLRDLPAGRLRPHLEAVAEAARGYLPDDTWEAQRFVEIIQRCGEWDAAAQLAQEIVDSVPDDTEHAMQRDGLLCLDGLCRLQQAIAAGRLDDARTALAQAQAAADRYRQVLGEHRHPWEAE
jgi:hypothetical protein